MPNKTFKTFMFTLKAWFYKLVITALGLAGINEEEEEREKVIPAKLQPQCSRDGRSQLPVSI